jgi:hypothetical protein
VKITLDVPAAPPPTGWTVDPDQDSAVFADTAGEALADLQRRGARPTGFYASRRRGLVMEFELVEDGAVQSMAELYSTHG